VRIGGAAKTASAIVVARSPKPMGVTAKMVSSASVGIARLTLDNASTNPPPRPECPSRAPTGTATTVASSTATTEMVRCTLSRARMPKPSSRVQLNGSLR